MPSTPFNRTSGCRVLVVCVGAIAATAVSRADDPATDRATFFERKVRPLLAERCYACHSESAGKSQGGLMLDHAAGLRSGGDTGPLVSPGEPDRSLLIEAIRYQSDLKMPPKGPLPNEERAVLEAWVRDGAFVPETDPPKLTRRTIDLAAGRAFWSFQPVHAHDPPAVRQADRVRTPVDAFVLARLEHEQLASSPMADRRVLLRRAAFQLTGLPPTVDEVAQFESDSSPTAWERQVDRLLARPEYGERWARHWLDLARYADKPAPWDASSGQPWLYRDWVVAALNSDMPYPEFVRQQLAADLIPGNPPENLAALGFLGGSPVLWKELKLDHQLIKATVAEEWEERLDAIGRTFLGLTVACARCHDHKFDPITTEDYYALAGVLASSRLIERYLLPEEDAQRVREAKARVQELRTALKPLEAANPKTDEQTAKIAELTAQIRALETGTPRYSAIPVCGVDEASIHVLPEGKDATRIEYRPGEPLDLAVQIRGNPASPGPVVARRFLAVLTSPEGPAPFRQGSGRLELANALTTDAAGLAARVIVNRVWAHHFGRGLVETPSDFGAQGARPSHPELLDDLAARFIAAGWHLKWLHREILLSSTWQQASENDPARSAIDPENRWLWRMAPQRLDLEAWRDAMLFASGQLDPARGGPSLSLSDPANRRRTLYGTIDRFLPEDMLRLHDFPDAFNHSPRREPTTTPLQQLFVLNSPFIRAQAEHLAARSAEGSPEAAARIERLYRWLWQRPPSDAQRAAGQAYLEAVGPAGWASYAQALLGSNEFLFLD